jgi:hypothetical protein
MQDSHCTGAAIPRVNRLKQSAYYRNAKTMPIGRIQDESQRLRVKGLIRHALDRLQ